MAPGNVAPFGEDDTVPESEQIVMMCCQKTHDSMRDCECTVPQGPCMVPPLLFTHYRRECFCFSCKWLRETSSSQLYSRIPKGWGYQVPNPTFGRAQLDDMLETQSSPPCTNLELVYPVLLNETQKKWKWVFRPVDDTQLSFLAPLEQKSDVSRVTLDSNGKWKALYADGRCSILRYDTRPGWNELYRDYGYAPGRSPYGPKGDSKSISTPDKVNPEGYMPSPPPSKSREHSANRNNTTLFIGGINANVTDKKFEELFEQFGEITYVNRPHQTSAFVQYAIRRDALMAMRQMQGVPIYNCRLRISWGNPEVKNQWDIPIKAGKRPFKGSKYHRLRQPQSVPQQMLQSFNNMPEPQNQQQQYRMPYTGYSHVPSTVGYPVQSSQYPHQQQMGHFHQHMALPPPPRPPPPGIATLSQPGFSQSAQSGHPPSFNTSAASQKGVLKGGGPIVVSSDMVPNPSQEPHGQSAPRSNSAPSPGSNQQANASSEDEKSFKTTGKTSPENGRQPAGESKGVLSNGQVYIKLEGADEPGFTGYDGYFVKEEP